MGNRVNVFLDVLAVHEDVVSEIADAYGYTDYDVDAWFVQEDISVPMVQFTFMDINWGHLPFLDELLAKGIAYTVTSEDDADGAEIFTNIRFTPEGGKEEKSHHASDSSISTGTMLSLIDDYSALKALILERKAAIHTIPWATQLEYGKLYQMRQLINPT